MRNKITSIAIGLIVSATTFGQEILLEESFDNDSEWRSEWSIIDTTTEPTLRPWGPATVKVVDGTLAMQLAGNIPPNPRPVIFDTGLVAATLDRSADDAQFANGFFRATIRARANTESIPSLFLRGDATTLSGYQFRANASSREFQIESFVNGQNVMLLGQMNRPEDPVVSVGENWIIEAGAINDRLSMKVWREGQPEPVDPQLVVIDDLFSGGQIAFGSSVSPSELGQATRVDVTFDNLLFRTVPEPATSGFMLCGLSVVMFIHRRRHRRS